jgi:hypothetical protein
VDNECKIKYNNYAIEAQSHHIKGGDVGLRDSGWLREMGAWKGGPGRRENRDRGRGPGHEELTK